MCNLFSVTTNQEAIRALFRKVNRYVGSLAPMPGVFPDYPAPVIRNTEGSDEAELVMMRWGMPPIWCVGMASGCTASRAVVMTGADRFPAIADAASRIKAASLLSDHGAGPAHHQA